jgi:hypothetical protein
VQGYYNAVLASSTPAEVQNGRDARYYKTFLADQPDAEALDNIGGEEDDPLEDPATDPLLESSTDPLIRPADDPFYNFHLSVALPPRTARGSNNTSGDGEPQSDIGRSRASSSDSSSSSAIVDIGPSSPPQLSGKYKLRHDQGRHKGGSAYQRLKIDCPLACDGHFDAKLCGKYRNTGPAQCKNWGPGEPQAFLIAWADAAPRFKTRAEHMVHEPCREDVLAAYRNLYK